MATNVPSATQLRRPLLLPTTGVGAEECPSGGTLTPAVLPGAITTDVSVDLATVVPYCDDLITVATAASTISLVAATQGRKIRLTNAGTAVATVTAFGIQTIDGLESRLLLPGQTVVLICHTAGTWKISERTNFLRTVLPGNVTNNNAVANTIADVTGLSFAVFANVIYNFRFSIRYTAAAATTGSRWSINGPATTFLQYTSRYTLSAIGETLNYASAYNVPAAANASSLTAGNRALIEGVVNPSVNGTVIARFASEVAGSAIVAQASYSYVEWEPIGTSIANTGVF